MEKISEENMDKSSKTIYVEPNKKPFNNAIHRVQEQVMEAYSEQLRSNQIYEQYNTMIPKLASSATTLQELGDFEIKYIKKDLEIMAQLYFGNEINYFEYIQGLVNIVNIFSIVRNNYNITHTQVDNK